MANAKAQPESTIGPGSQVDHFRVVRLIGRGGMAEVYLARDTRLGRKVALKVVRRESLGSPEAAERFLFEARATARFAHPHIVTVHAAGEHDGVPYVALEYVEGQNLRQRLEEERPAAREAMRIALAVAEALAEAHRHGILHRDLKPENVLLPKDGRVRVVDFGLAKAMTSGVVEAAPGIDEGEAMDPAGDTEVSLDTEQDSFETRDGAIRGTPSYMAPEQWTDAPVSGATDVWALGAVLHEMLTGKPPYRAPSPLKLAVKVCGPDPVDPLPPGTELPAELCDLVGGCLEKDPDLRPTAAQVAETLGELLAVRHAKAGEEESPFRGLRPFSERHAEYFYGRTAEVAAFVERLREEPVLPVVGPSGAGKSSFVQAGVIPRLREGGSWAVLAMRPGRSPFRTLASRFLARERATFERTLPSGELHEVASARERDDFAEDRLAEDLRASPLQLNLLLASLAEHQGSRVLLFVDQLEELYALVEDEEERLAFMEALCGAADDPGGPVRVVFTLRDDFLGRLAGGPTAREALGRVTVLRSPGRDALEEILTRPVEDVGYAYDDPTLVPEMVEAVRGEPASLPLLQFATRMLWDRRDRHRRLLCRAVYEAMGGVEGALANHADGVLEGMSPAQVGLARRLLLGMVTPEGTRRVVPRREVLERLGPGGEEVLDRLVQARLVSVRKGQGDDDDGAELELAHESLITRWRRLARWQEEGREEMAFLAELGQAAALWERRGRRADEVWTNDALGEARRNLERLSAAPPQGVMEFLEAGRRRAEQTHRRKTVRRAVLTALLVVVAISGMVGAFAFRAQKQEALSQREEARGALAAAQREGAEAALGRRDLLEARARLRAALEIQDSPLARALWWRLARDPLVWRKELGVAAYGVSFSPDGETIAVASMDHAVQLFDTKTLRYQVQRGHDDQVLAVSFSPDGAHLASATYSGMLRVTRLADGTSRQLKGPATRISSLSWSPDGRLLAASGHDKLVHVWDLGSGAPPRDLEGHDAAVSTVSWSPDGARLASGDLGGAIRLWDASDWSTARVLKAHATQVSDLAWSPDGELLASAGHEVHAPLWKVSSGEQVGTLGGTKTGAIAALAWSPDGARIVTGGTDGRLVFWDAASRTAGASLAAHEDSVGSVEWSPDGAFVASAGYDGAVTLWSATTAPEAPRLPPHGAAVYTVSVSHDGASVASGDAEGGVRVWELASGAVRESVEAPGGTVFDVAWSPDGATLATAGGDGLVRLRRFAKGGVNAILGGHLGSVQAVAWSPNGTLLASAGLDKTIRIWRAATREPARTLDGHELGVWCVAFDPSGRRLASGSYDRTVRVWDLEGSAEPLVLRGHEGLVWGVAWSPDGTSLATAGLDGTLRLWDLEAGAGRVLARVPGRAYSVAFSEDGGTIALTSSDGVARLVDLSGEVRQVLSGHRAEVNSVAFAPGSDLVVTGGDDGTVRVFRADDGRPSWWAPALLASPPRLLGHRGGVDLVTGAVDDRAPTAEWEKAVRSRAHFVDEVSEVACVQTFEGDLEIWDRASDRHLSTEPVPGLRAVVALPEGCATLGDRGVRLHGPTGAARELASSAGAMAWDGQRLLVAADREVLAFSPEGERLESVPVEPGATALAAVGGRVVAGFADGSLEVVSWPGEPPRLPPPFDDTPPSPVVRIVPAPMDTIAVGFSDGLLGIWGGGGGGRLHAERLHGPVVHLRYREPSLYAATELGDGTSLDLSVFDLSWCEVLTQVWSAVPVVWRTTAPEPAAPDPTHPCAAASTASAVP